MPSTKRSAPGRDDSFRTFVLEQLAGIEEIRANRMFGGFGLYSSTLFFGIIHHGRLYFRTSPESRESYLSAGSAVFRPSPRATLKAYYEVPAAVLEDRLELTKWAKEAIQVAAAVDAS